MMLKTLRLTALSTMLALGGAACGDGTTEPDDLDDNNTGLGAEEQAALRSALTTSGALSSTPVAGFAAMVVGVLGDVGTISTHETAALSQSIESGIQLAVTSAMSNSYEGAVGIQVGYDVNGIQGWFLGVVGWNGLNSTGSITQLVGVYHFDVGSDEPPTTHSASIGLEDMQQAPARVPGDHHLALATYWNGTNSYWGVSGSMEFSGSSFSGSNNCGQQSFSCTYATGTMNGSFDFVAETLMGDISWTQVPVSFTNLPAVRLSISQSL